jgi:cytochrome P450
MLEATMALAVLLQRFEIRSEGEAAPPDTHGMTLRPSGAVPIAVHRRA